jgi:hypothetical protein
LRRRHSFFDYHGIKRLKMWPSFQSINQQKDNSEN